MHSCSPKKGMAVSRWRKVGERHEKCVFAAGLCRTAAGKSASASGNAPSGKTKNLPLPRYSTDVSTMSRGGVVHLLISPGEIRDGARIVSVGSGKITSANAQGSVR